MNSRASIILLLISLSGLAGAATAAPRPNILFVFLDDAGWADLSCYGSPVTNKLGQPITPNMDRLASQGIRFTQGYVASPICSPSRTGVLTGMEPCRYGLYSYFDNKALNASRNMPDWLQPDTVTAPRLFQRAGYKTGQFGKWHMGNGRDVNDAPVPAAYGFDESLVAFEGNGNRLLYWNDDGSKYGLSQQNEDATVGTFQYCYFYEAAGKHTDAALAFITNAVHAGRPFYVHVPYIFPLAGFIINGLGRKIFGKRSISSSACLLVFASFVASVFAFLYVREYGAHVYYYFDFINVASLRIPFALQLDQLSALFLLIITGIGFLIHVYSASYMKDESSEHYARYFAYLNLFIFSMLILVLAANYVIMFIGWEGVGLCSYLLIGFWFKNTEYNKAANKAFVMNRIGDLGFLIAIFWIISKVGNTNFSDVFANTKSFSPTEMTIVTLLLFVGATGKSAQIPLYTWLPDAMAGPTPVSALIHAATMVTAGIYMIARSNALYSLSSVSMNVVAIVGLATSILAATIALKQYDIKKILAYSTVSQLGYMFLALGVGAYSTGVFHVMTHAFFKALLFLGAGSVIHAMGGEQDIRKMGGLGKLKITSITFLVGCIAISGVPPFSGFFSKDAILLAAFEQNKILYAIALFGAMLTAYYMFRLFFVAFTGSFRGTEEQKHHLHESPPAMTIVLVILAILSVVGGFIGIPEVLVKGGDRLSEFLAPVIPVRAGGTISVTTEFSLMALSTVLVILAILFAWIRFRKYDFKASTGLGKILENKWYVDEIYDAVIVRPLGKFGEVLNEALEKSGIDALVNGVGRAVQYGGRQLRWLQSGQVGSYVLLMVVSMVLFFVLQFFLHK